MTTQPHYDAETAQFSQILEKIRAGEEVVIDESGSPLAKVLPLRDEFRRDGRGSLKGQIWISDDFDEPDEEIERMFGMRP